MIQDQGALAKTVWVMGQKHSGFRRNAEMLCEPCFSLFERKPVPTFLGTTLANVSVIAPGPSSRLDSQFTSQRLFDQFAGFLNSVKRHERAETRAAFLPQQYLIEHLEKGD